MNIRKTTLFYCLIVLVSALPVAWGQPPAAPLPFISPIFGDHMMLQQDKPNRIWGWSQPGDTVRVEIAGHSVTAIAGPDGRWQAQIQPPKPGGPCTVQLAGFQTVERK